MTMTGPDKVPLKKCLPLILFLWICSRTSCWAFSRAEALGLGPTSSPVSGLLITNYCCPTRLRWRT